MIYSNTNMKCINHKNDNIHILLSIIYTYDFRSFYPCPTFLLFCLFVFSWICLHHVEFVITFQSVKYSWILALQRENTFRHFAKITWCGSSSNPIPRYIFVHRNCNGVKMVELLQTRLYSQHFLLNTVNISHLLNWIIKEAISKFMVNVTQNTERGN